jgi:hypothetical protein
MPAGRFGGEGKQRGEGGVKRRKSAAPFPREEGSPRQRQRAREVATAVPDQASEGRRWWPADRAGPPVSEGEAAGHAGPEGGERGGPRLGRKPEMAE